MQLSTAIDWAAGRTFGVLITIRRDGRPQSSDIVYAVEDGGVSDIDHGRASQDSQLAERPVAAVLHVTDAARWSYLSFDGTVDLSPVATSPDDATIETLVRYYEMVNKAPHPDWDEYRRAMIDEQRLIARFTPASVVGQIN